MGLDPSYSNYGWAVLSGGTLVESGRISTSASDAFLLRLRTLKVGVRRLVEQYQPACVTVEDYITAETYSEDAAVLLVATLEVLWESAVDTLLINPSTLKSLTSDFYRHKEGVPASIPIVTDKSFMIETARLDTGKNGLTGDEADGYLLAKFGSMFWALLRGDNPELTPKQQTAFAGIKRPKTGRNAGRTIKTGLAFREGKSFWRWSAPTVRGEIPG